MGVIRSIIDDLDNSKELTEDMRETLDMLMGMAETKADLFEREIKEDLLTGKTTDTLTIPITKVLTIQKQYRCTTSSGASDILKDIKDAIQSMIKDSSAGGIVDGIATMLNSALNVILGAAEGQEQVAKLYTAAIDGISIVRLDFAFWSRKIKAESIKKHMESALSCIAYKSVADVSKISLSEFLVIYYDLISVGFQNITDENERVNKIIASVENAEKIYNMLSGKSKHDNSAIDINYLNELSRKPRIRAFISAPEIATIGNF